MSVFYFFLKFFQYVPIIIMRRIIFVKKLLKFLNYYVIIIMKNYNCC